MRLPTTKVYETLVSVVGLNDERQLSCGPSPVRGRACASPYKAAFV